MANEIIILGVMTLLIGLLFIAIAGLIVWIVKSEYQDEIQEDK